MMFDSAQAIAGARFMLGLYWLAHGIKAISDQSKDKQQLSKMMISLRAKNQIGSNLKNHILRNSRYYSIIIPYSWSISGGLLILGILDQLATLSIIVICISILLMEPSGPGSVRLLLFFIGLSVIILVSPGSYAYSLYPLRLW